MSTFPGNREWEREHHDRYTPVTKGSVGLGDKYGFIFHGDALPLRDFSLEERRALAKGFHSIRKPVSFMDGHDIGSNDGRITVVRVSPQIGGVGWRRYPGFDHYKVCKDGCILFKTTNYRYVLKYLRLYAARNPQPAAPVTVPTAE